MKIKSVISTTLASHSALVPPPRLGRGAEAELLDDEHAAAAEDVDHQPGPAAVLLGHHGAAAHVDGRLGQVDGANERDLLVVAHSRAVNEGGALVHEGVARTRRLGAVATGHGGRGRAHLHQADVRVVHLEDQAFGVRRDASGNGRAGRGRRGAREHGAQEHRRDSEEVDLPHGTSCRQRVRCVRFGFCWFLIDSIVDKGRVPKASFSLPT